MRSIVTSAQALALPLCALAALPGCSPSEEEGEAIATAQQVAEGQAAASPSSAPAPDGFAATAWRTLAAGGARYTTYLDQDGTYRDLRNGDPWQTGEWTYADGEDGKRLCLRPDADTGIERCWEPDRMRGDMMRLEGETGTLIELESVEYVLPSAQPSDASDDPA